eukprot:3380748-Amphidinium_carterae.1
MQNFSFLPLNANTAKSSTFFPRMVHSSHKSTVLFSNMLRGFNQLGCFQYARCFWIALVHVLNMVRWGNSGAEDAW